MEMKSIIVTTSNGNIEELKKQFAGMGRVKEDLPLVNGFVAEVPQDLDVDSFQQELPDNIKLMSAEGARGGNVRIASNAHFSIPTPIELTPGYKAADYPNPADRIDVLKEVLNMQEVWDKGFTGKGIGIAVVDTGIYPHDDIKDRIIAFKDFVNDKTEPYDDNGHGTHCSGCAAGSGARAGGKFKGTAPEANLIGVKVLNKQGGGSMSNIINGIQWVIDNKEKYNIRVMSMSLGGPALQKEKNDLVALAVKKCLEAGIVPVIAAGNSGPGLGTIGTPAISTDALTVGAYNDRNTVEKDDDVVAYFSSRGPTVKDMNLKPDILTPGVQIVSCNSPGSYIDKNLITHLGEDYVLMSGTSMATPAMAGVVADVIQANPKLNPADVIMLCKNTANPMPDTHVFMQGAGLADPGAATDYARHFNADNKDVKG